MTNQICEAGKEKKTISINTTCLVIATGTACNGPVAWESAYIVFQLPSNEEAKWHSDNVEAICAENGIPNVQHLRERYVRLNALLRETKRGLRVWRVKEIEYL